MSGSFWKRQAKQTKVKRSQCDLFGVVVAFRQRFVQRVRFAQMSRHNLDCLFVGRQAVRVLSAMQASTMSDD